ncbi:MAG: DNA topoisomerase III [Nevskia sp.]
MRVFLCEKPSQARDIAAVLGANQKGDGCLLGQEVAVTWCFGHLMEMAAPEAYDPAYKRWSLDTLPILPAEWKIEVKKDGAKQFRAIRTLIKQASEVVVATDADREGETIGREILDAVNWRGRVLRLWLSALDPASIRKALGALLPGEKTAPLYLAGLGRARADWLVGMNLTRAFTLLGTEGGADGVRSVGRVQTPTLRLVVERDSEIEQFVPRAYWDITAHCTPPGSNSVFKARWKPANVPMDTEGRCTSEPAARTVAQRIAGRNGRVALAETKRLSEPPPLPFDLSGLQQECSRRFGMGAQETLDSAQRLYEQWKATTYPRTDCPYLPESQLAESIAVMAAVAGSDPTAMSAFVRAADPARRSRAWDDRKITAHHAIIPTAVRVKPEEMNEADRRVYDLIRRRYVAQFHPAYEFNLTRIELLIEGEHLHVTGRVPVVMGWRVVIAEAPDDEADDERASLPPLKHGDAVLCAKAEVERKQTQPPARHTEGTLIQAMKSVGRQVQDAKLRQVLKETSGIGTEATRAAIIETLLARGYIERQGKKKLLVSTLKGRVLIAAVPDSVKDAATTAVWEQALDDIAQGKAGLDEFLAKQRAGLRELMAEIKAHTPAKATGGARASQPERSSPSLRRSPAARHQAPATAASGRAQRCPSCKTGTLVQKTARKGSRAGQLFWACNGWPKCSYVKND